jgi:NTP pyrophosphatase (non-canonical NTP hydrolase)
MEKKEITLSQIQKEVDDWANQFTKPYFEPLSRMAAMTEEVGEVARVINNMYGDKKKKEDENEKHLEEELGDLLFTLVCMANAEGINLTDACERKMDKVLKRDNNRWERKSNE